VQGRLIQFAGNRLPLIEEELLRRMPLSTLAGTEGLNSAVRYAVCSGGKRTRPMLTLIAGGLFLAPAEAVIRAACGVEFLHLSSVILDDLPPMDDATMRRHVPALHIAYGEGLALLAALALYARAFELFAGVPGLAEEAAKAVGCEGMIGGQAADLQGVAGSRLEKTSALMRLALRAGAMAGHAEPEELAVLSEYGSLAGEAYQICDDLLDALGNEALTGKTSGQDQRHGRPALTPDYSVEDAFERAKRLTELAAGAVRGRMRSCEEADLLCEFAESIILRVADLVERNDSDRLDSRAPGPGGGQRGALAEGESRGRACGSATIGSDTGA